MIHSQPVASPLSRNDIRQHAFNLRRLVSLQDTYDFPILPFIELVFCSLSGYTFLIGEAKEMPRNHAETDVQRKIIRVREDVYEGAIENKPRDRMTLAHELGHAVLHDGGISLARSDPDTRFPAYCDPEWQAAAFAGELLVPMHLIKTNMNLSACEVARRCLVSVEAANIQLRTSGVTT